MSQRGQLWEEEHRPVACRRGLIALAAANLSHLVSLACQIVSSDAHDASVWQSSRESQGVSVLAPASSELFVRTP
jgi:hypothetical protein